MREYMLIQKDFCKLIGISPSTYNPIENNVKQGNAETILLIAKGLNRKVEDIWYLVDQVLFLYLKFENEKIIFKQD